MKSFSKLLICLAAAAVPLFAQTVDPCTQTIKLSQTATGVQTFTANSNGNKNLSGSSYGYEMWTEGGNNNKLIWFGPNQGGGAAFRTEWNNPNDYLGRVGYFMNQGKPYTDYKNLYADYNYTRSGNNTGGGYSYIGIYGWTKNPQVEWYIVEDWFSGSILSSSGIVGTFKGDFTTSAGVQYKIYRNTRPAGSGNILNDGKAFPQYFSVRQRANSSPSSPMCGSIAITEHFKKWETFSDMKMGTDLYEAKFLVEAGGGTGWFEATYLKLSQEDNPRGTATTPSSSSRASSSSTVSSSSRASSSSGAAATQANNCNNFIGTLPANPNPPANPYTACFKHTNNNCYVCKISSESDDYKCNASWIWNGDYVDENLDYNPARWYQAVTCPAGTSSSSAASSSSGAGTSSSAGSSSSGQQQSSSSEASSSGDASSSSGAEAQGDSSSSQGSSAEEQSSSSGSGNTPVIALIPNSEAASFKYYTLKGEPLGSRKPAKPGVYIVRDGHSVKKIAVR